MKQICLKESGTETIQPDHSAAVFDAPGLVVEGWKRATLFPAHIDRRVYRVRKCRGLPRLTTKVST